MSSIQLTWIKPFKRSLLLLKWHVRVEFECLSQDTERLDKLQMRPMQSATEWSPLDGIKKKKKKNTVLSEFSDRKDIYYIFSELPLGFLYAVVHWFNQVCFEISQGQLSV